METYPAIQGAAKSQASRFTRIAQVGVLLAGEHHLPRLYSLIVHEALALTNAQAGAVYMRHGDRLEAVTVQIASYAQAEGFKGFGKGTVPLSRESLCGRVILEDKPLNSPDLRVLPTEHPAGLYPECMGPARGDGRSLLALPLKTPQSGLMGVLILLNACSADGTVIPFEPPLEDLMLAVAAQAALSIQNVRWAAQLHQAYQDTLYRLSLAAEYREDPSGSHIRRIGQYAALVAAAYGLPEEQVEMIRVASAMHDIGKISIPETILLKPGRVTPEEFERIKKHTTLGALILGGSKTDVLQMAERIAISHHEKFDGSGYPFGQAGVEIPLEGRIVGLVDVFDALTTVRPYKKPISFSAALETIQQEANKHFDPDCVGAFLKVQNEVRRILEGVAPGPP
jgi:HD-GYP domain-containing protein (c-di-GMP phosphodiesterase class II)